MTERLENRETSPLRLLMRHVPVPWVFVLTYLLGVGLELVWPTRRPVGALLAIKIAGAVVFALGGAIAGWGWGSFRRVRTTTVPGQLSSTLVTAGPYQYSRNAMYVGLAVAYLGEAGMLVQAWPVVLLPLVLAYLNWVVIPVEEQRLVEAFGETYEAYRRRVRRWL